MMIQGAFQVRLPLQENFKLLKPEHFAQAVPPSCAMRQSNFLQWCRHTGIQFLPSCYISAVGKPASTT